MTQELTIFKKLKQSQKTECYIQTIFDVRALHRVIFEWYFLSIALVIWYNLTVLYKAQLCNQERIISFMVNGEPVLI